MRVKVSPNVWMCLNDAILSLYSSRDDHVDGLWIKPEIAEKSDGSQISDSEIPSEHLFKLVKLNFGSNLETRALQ